MFKIKLTKDQIEDFGAKIFDLNFPDKKFGEFKDQASFVRNDWVKAAYDAIDGYNTVVTYIDFPGISIVKNCCLICYFNNFYHHTCNNTGKDTYPEGICDEFKLVEFESDDEKEAKKEADKEWFSRIHDRMNETPNEYDPYHY